MFWRFLILFLLPGPCSFVDSVFIILIVSESSRHPNHMFKLSKSISRLTSISFEYFRNNLRHSRSVSGHKHVTFGCKNVKSKFQFIFFKDGFPVGHHDYISFSVPFEASVHLNDVFKVSKSISRPTRIQLEILLI